MFMTKFLQGVEEGNLSASLTPGLDSWRAGPLASDASGIPLSQSLGCRSPKVTTE